MKFDTDQYEVLKVCLQPGTLESNGADVMQKKWFQAGVSFLYFPICENNLQAGASVDCTGVEFKSFGIVKKQLFPTDLVLRTANGRKSLLVLYQWNS